MTGPATARWQCPQCGYIQASNDDLAPNAFLRPWHVRGRGSVKAYVESLGIEAREWLLALYVDPHLHLLAVDTIGRGDVGSCPVPFNRIVERAFQLKASAYILVHNHPSGDPKPSIADIKTTVRLARLSADLEIPLLDHLIIAGDQMISCGHF